MEDKARNTQTYLRKAGIVISCFILYSLSGYAQLPAFPGAEGWGAATIGGRGGSVIEVTNLNDAGPGSFREACNASGPRTVVFRTGGIIELQTEIEIINPYITIAAQTAPGDGIVLKNYSLSTFTHDIIIRGLRLRPGDGNIHDAADTRDCITMQAGSHHIIIDHCSMSWGIDENVNLWDSSNHITLQWNIISEGLYHSIHPKGPHSMALLIGNESNKTSTHHNLLAHNNARNPLIIGRTNHEFLNNVIYDWGYGGEFLENGEQVKVDIAGNYWKPRTSIVDTSEMPLKVDFDSSTAFGSRLYIKNNMYVGINFLNAAQIANMGGNAVVISNISLLDSASTVTFDTPLYAYDTVLAWAGALHPQRDSTDIRMLTDVQDSTGGLVDCMYPSPILLDSGAVMSGTDSSIIYSQFFTNPAISAEGRKILIVSGTGAGQFRTGMHMNVIDSALRIAEAVVDTPWTVIPDSTSHYQTIVTCDTYVGGWGTYASGTAPIDSDHDGMPDAWETAHGLNPLDSTDRNGTDIDSTGYTNLEVYLNEFYQPNTANGISEISAPSITIYPNPVHDRIFISAIGQWSMANGRLSIHDMTGRLVYEETIGNSYSASINVSGLSSGLYSVEITSGSTIRRSRFVKD
jgi:pectate lyase